VIIDVRTAQEFDNGHIPESINIPVDRVASNAERIKAMKRPVVVCCSAGTRGMQAVQRLKEKGVKDIYNGGSWQHVLKLISRI
jgi:rhodanese-related sulfurtransferase